ncbi:MAG: hypothetical protein IJ858_06740 [Acidaminococcaceae bacterium]|nr:hypothetical protein [Acidaminococcaceae bacterium]MBR2183102.1 hypothetical protein [Acidaminococcaceae bacterium]
MNKQISPRDILAFILAVICIYAMSSCGSCKRTMKNIDSDIHAGVERIATLYDYNGKIIQRWEGKMDMSSDTVETYLLIGEKRVIVHGGIMVVEEK